MKLTRLARHAFLRYRRQWWPQVLALLGLWAVCEALTHSLGWPIPGSILGLFLLLTALESGLVPVAWFRRGASSLLGHLILFLVPAMLAATNHHEFFNSAGLKLLAAILIGTPLVMIGTAVVVEIGFRLSARL